jgi:hypothetical protein
LDTTTDGEITSFMVYAPIPLVYDFVPAVCKTPQVERYSQFRDYFFFPKR